MYLLGVVISHMYIGDDGWSMNRKVLGYLCITPMVIFILGGLGALAYYFPREFLKAFSIAIVIFITGLLWNYGIDLLTRDKS